MWLFKGKKQKPKAPTAEETAEAIQKLQAEIEIQQARQNLLSIKAENARKTALDKRRSKDEKGALRALKLRKEYLKQSEVIDGTMLNMQTMCFSLEAALSNAGTISVLENANKHIGRIYDGISVDKMEDIRDEMEENQQRRTEIEEVLSRPLDSQQEGLDEDDLARELDELEAEEMETKMLNLEPPVRSQPTAVREPVVARTEAPVPAKKTTTEDDELNALWAEMQMP
jgi:hypothetical protein